jgi:hypothetical protein
MRYKVLGTLFAYTAQKRIGNANNRGSNDSHNRGKHENKTMATTGYNVDRGPCVNT